MKIGEWCSTCRRRNNEDWCSTCRRHNSDDWRNTRGRCGTCHMASSFLPLSRTTTTAICSSSNLLAATFTQCLASHPTSGSLLTTSSPLQSPLIVTSHPDQKGLTPLLALLLISIRDALLTTYALLPSHRSVDSQVLILIILSSESFYCRNGVLATNIINTASAPHQTCQHPTKGALLLAQANGLTTFLALLPITIRRHLLTTSSR